jgi:hypothetical protein
VRYGICVDKEFQWFERTLSSLEKDGFGHLFDHVKERLNSYISSRSRSSIMSLNSIMRWILGLDEVDSNVSLRRLKSPKSIHGRS